MTKLVNDELVAVDMAVRPVEMIDVRLTANLEHKGMPEAIVGGAGGVRAIGAAVRRDVFVGHVAQQG